MKKLYCVICGKCIKFEKTWNIILLRKTLPPSIIWYKCKNEDEKLFKKE